MFKILTTILLLSGNLLAKPIRVAILDSGVTGDFKFCKQAHVSMTGTGYKDNHGHGTFVAKLFAEYAGESDYCITSVKYYEPTFSGPNNLETFVKGLEYLSKQDVDVIVIAGGGPETPKQIEEYGLMKKLLDRNVKIIAAAGNGRTNLNQDCYYYPACYDSRITVVGCTNFAGNRCSSSNYGLVVDIWELGTFREMSGTSMATGVAAGKLVKLLAARRAR